MSDDRDLPDRRIQEAAAAAGLVLDLEGLAAVRVQTGILEAFHAEILAASLDDHLDPVAVLRL